MSGRFERGAVVHIGVRSAMRLTFWLSLSLWAVGGVGLLALYGIGAVAGGLGGFRGFMATLGLTGVWVSPIAFVPVFSTAAIGGSAVTSMLVGLAAALFNALTPILGGVEIARLGRRSPEREVAPRYTVTEATSLVEEPPTATTPDHG